MSISVAVLKQRHFCCLGGILLPPPRCRYTLQKPVADMRVKRWTIFSWIWSAEISSSSCAVSEIMMFSCKLKMTSWYYIRLGALYAVCYDGFWKGDHGFPLMFHGKFSSNTHRFRDNEVFLRTENDVINISPLGGTVYSCQRRNLEGW